MNIELGKINTILRVSGSYPNFFMKKASFLENNALVSKANFSELREAEKGDLFIVA